LLERRKKKNRERGEKKNGGEATADFVGFPLFLSIYPSQLSLSTHTSKASGSPPRQRQGGPVPFNSNSRERDLGERVSSVFCF
jgi:hypothetical protein